MCIQIHLSARYVHKCSTQRKSKIEACMEQNAGNSVRSEGRKLR